MTSWPKLSLEEARAVLTGPGARYEMAEVAIRGIATRVWKNVPPTVAALVVQSRLHGARPFSVYQDERISYEGNFRAVATLGHWLISQGVRPGDRVALALRNLPEWPVIFLAALCVGAIAVPLNAWGTGAELAGGLSDSGARILFCDAERLERVADRLHELTTPCRAVLTRAGGANAAAHVGLEDILGPPTHYERLQARALPEIALEPDDDAVIFYTSGTSGRPKGVLGTHRNLLTQILTASYAGARDAVRRGEPTPPNPAPRVRLLTVPLFHVTGCAAYMLGGMTAGNTSVYMRRWDPAEALRMIERHRVNLAGGVPTMVLQLLESPARPDHDLSSLVSVAYGGAPSPPGLAARVRAELGAAPGVGWGMTETMSVVASLSAEDYLARPQSCGPAVPVADLKVTGPHASELPTGAIGELWAKGPMVAKGYWNDPDETAAVFVDGWVRTGDLGRLDRDGFCTIVDRAKDMIIRGGENIYASEVESVLQNHFAVREAALVGLPHPTLGEEPAAVIHLAPGHSVADSELREWTSRRLGAFKVPVRILFMEEPLPRNAAGKLVKAELRRLFDRPLS